MTDEAGLIGLPHRADWTRLRLSARLSDGSAVVIAPGQALPVRDGRVPLRARHGGRPWHLLDADDDDDDGEVHWFGGPELPVPRLLCPAWLLEGFKLEVRGRVRVCGREALDVVASSQHERGSAEAAVDAEGILLRVVEPGVSGEPDVLEMVTADFDQIDPAIFRAPPGSLRGEGYGAMLGGGGGRGASRRRPLGWRPAAGAWIRHAPQRPGETPGGPDSAPAIPDPDPAPAVSPEGRAAVFSSPTRCWRCCARAVLAGSRRPCTSGSTSAAWRRPCRACAGPGSAVWATSWTRSARALEPPGSRRGCASLDSPGIRSTAPISPRAVR